MPEDSISKMDRTELKNLARSLLWQYRLVDAFWFINIENRFDLATAEDLNAAVWGKVGKLSAKNHQASVRDY